MQHNHFNTNTKVWLDVETQQMAILRRSPSHLQWEQKLVSQIIKTVCVNAYISWVMFFLRDILTFPDTFKGLNKYRNALKRVQCIAYYMLKVVQDILICAQTLSSAEETTDVV